MSSRAEFMRQMGLSAADLEKPNEPLPSKAANKREPEPSPVRVAAGPKSGTSQAKADFLRSLGIDNFQESPAAASATRNATGSQELPKAGSMRQPPSSGTFRRVEEEEDESSFRGAYTPKLREPQRDDLTLGRKPVLERAPANPVLDAELQGMTDAAGAEEVKAMGNKFFQAGDYRKAVRLYTRAIELDGSNSALYSNRSAAYLLGGKQMGIDTRSMALRDADKTIKLKPTWFKGYSRRGDALFKLERYDEAMEAYQHALERDPGNSGVINSMNELKPLVSINKSAAHASWAARDESIIKASVASASSIKTSDKTAHEMLDEFMHERAKATPHLGRGGVDYKDRELERFRHRSTTDSSFYASEERSAEPTAQTQSSSKPLSQREIPSEFSSDAARDYQEALLESYRKKKAQQQAGRR